MTLPAAYATISLGDINVELGRSRTSNISLDTAENGGYGAININSPSYPASGNPASISEWYSYNHNATAPDTTPPTTPYLNSIGDFGGGFLRLTWTASTDASGIYYYDVYREVNNSGIFGVIAQPTVTSYDDYDVVNGNTYAYKIKAIDNAINQSAFSNTRSVFYNTGGGTPIE